MVKVGKDLWRSSEPTTLLRQDDLESLAQDPIQVVFEDLSGRGDSTTSLGNVVPVLSHLHSKEVFPDVQRCPDMG